MWVYLGGEGEGQVGRSLVTCWTGRPAKWESKDAEFMASQSEWNAKYRNTRYIRKTRQLICYDSGRNHLARSRGHLPSCLASDMGGRLVRQVPILQMYVRPTAHDGVRGSHKSREHLPCTGLAPCTSHLASMRTLSHSHTMLGQQQDHSRGGLNCLVSTRSGNY